jgi:hypothetical protein
VSGIRPIELKNDAPIARYRNDPLPAPLASQWVKPLTRQIHSCRIGGVEISQETQARLANEARKRGVSVDALLARFIDELAALTQPAQPAAALPVWHLGGARDLHRRDIYSDAR